MLDALFVAVLPWGLEGAALATFIGQFVGGVLPILYFARKNGSLLKLGKLYFNGREFLQVCLNGSSEMLSNISASVVGMLYNFQLLKYLGEDGVSAYGVLMYLGMIFSAIFFGYTVGTAPVISFHFGKANRDELRSLKRKCLVIIAISSLLMFGLAIGLSEFLSYVFVGYDKALFELTVHAFYIYSLSFLFFGFTIFTSSFFTALNDGPVSAAISFLRTVVFQAGGILLFPLILKAEGIWWSIVISEALALFTSAVFLRIFKKKYQY